MPPGEIDLVCYIAWLLVDGTVKTSSYAQYLSGVRRFCANENLAPLPPSPSESRLLTDALKAAKRFEGEFPVKEGWTRAGISAAHSLQVLEYDPDTRDYAIRKRKALWQVAFVFAFRGGTVGALHGADFAFVSDFEMSVRPNVLKRTNTDCTRDPRRRLYSVPPSTPASRNPVLYLRSFVTDSCRLFGADSFLFSRVDGAVDSCGPTDYVSSEIVAMARMVGIAPPPGMRFMSHSPRRGMLTEMVLHHPRPDPLVVRQRLDWTSDNTVTYFCRAVMRSSASSLYVPGALQDQGA